MTSRVFSLSHSISIVFKLTWYLAITSNLPTNLGSLKTCWWAKWHSRWHLFHLVYKRHGYMVHSLAEESWAIAVGWHVCCMSAKKSYRCMVPCMSGTKVGAFPEMYLYKMRYRYLVVTFPQPTHYRHSALADSAWYLCVSWVWIMT